MQLYPIKNAISTLALSDFLFWSLVPDFRDLILKRSLNSQFIQFGPRFRIIDFEKKSN